MALIPSKSNSTRKNLLKDQSGHYVFGIDFPNYVKISVSMNEYKVNLEEFKVNNKESCYLNGNSWDNVVSNTERGPGPGTL